MAGPAGHQRELVVGGEVDEARIVDRLTTFPAQHLAERLQGHGRGMGEADRIGRPVALGHVPRLARRCLQARPGRRLGADAAHQILDHGVAAVEVLLAQALEDALRGDVRIEPKQLVDLWPKRIELRTAPASRPPDTPAPPSAAPAVITTAASLAAPTGGTTASTTALRPAHSVPDPVSMSARQSRPAPCSARVQKPRSVSDGVP